MTKKTVGSIASELLSQSNTQDVIETQRATEQEYLDNLIWAVKHAQKKIDCSSIEGHKECASRIAFEKDFFIVVLLKKEKLLENVLRNYFITTLACPTPHFDQTVYRYDHKKEDVEFIWVVPDKETCEILSSNATIIVPEERQLLRMVLDYYDGTLFRIAKKFNGEHMAPGVALEKGN